MYILIRETFAFRRTGLFLLRIRYNIPLTAVAFLVISDICLLNFRFSPMLTPRYLAWLDHDITLPLTEIGLTFWLRLQPNRTVTDLLSFIFSFDFLNQVEDKFTRFCLAAM